MPIRERTYLALLEAGKQLTQERDLERLLQRIVEIAVEVVGCRYGALGILDETGDKLERFITVGLDDETRARIGALPTGHGLLGVLIREPHPLRLKRLGDDPRSAGFPPHHPPMNSFLGVPIMKLNGVRGRLYLTEKIDADEFDDVDEEIAVTVASQAAIAIENAELYARLEAVNAELAETSRHKSAFLANMSHELRTPLNTIIGYTSLMLEAPENLNDEQIEDLEIVQRSGRHLLSLIGDLLEIGRIETGKLALHLEDVDVPALLDELFAALRPQLADGVELAIEAPEQLTIRADRKRLLQLLLNIAGNAVKFTAHGTIAIEARPAANGQVAIAVRDTGPGIPEHDLARIFESFFQSEAALARTPRPAEGAGLGLAIAKALAEAHGGGVDIASTDGSGTIVTVTLPKVANIAEASRGR